MELYPADNSIKYINYLNKTSFKDGSNEAVLRIKKIQVQPHTYKYEFKTLVNGKNTSSVLFEKKNVNKKYMFMFFVGLWEGSKEFIAINESDLSNCPQDTETITTKMSQLGSNDEPTEGFNSTTNKEGSNNETTGETDPSSEKVFYATLGAGSALLISVIIGSTVACLIYRKKHRSRPKCKEEVPCKQKPQEFTPGERPLSLRTYVNPKVQSEYTEEGIYDEISYDQPQYLDSANLKKQ